MKQELYNIKKTLKNVIFQSFKAFSKKDDNYINFLSLELDKIEERLNKEESIEKDKEKQSLSDRKKYFIDSFSFYLLKKDIKKLRSSLIKKRY
jgi:hypothetical protein